MLSWLLTSILDKTHALLQKLAQPFSNFIAFIYCISFPVVAPHALPCRVTFRLQWDLRDEVASKLTSCELSC